MLKKIRRSMILLVIIFAAGCSQNVTISPQADMLITGYRAGNFEVAVCLDGQMVAAGKVSCKDLEGYTLTVFEDWHEVCR